MHQAPTGSPPGRRPCDPRPEVEETPAGRGGSLEPHDLEEKVDEASDESFPASDPPAFCPVTSP